MGWLENSGNRRSRSAVVESRLDEESWSQIPASANLKVVLGRGVTGKNSHSLEKTV